MKIDSSETKEWVPVLPLAPVTRTVGRFAIEETLDALEFSDYYKRKRFEPIKEEAIGTSINDRQMFRQFVVERWHVSID